ncbi:hypothetical protein DL93DRAFT_805903 [Clavulina sp. PMI_390]|nr:hypothetical protein DL93DRAFT_805903 [Clavulina sp. PMI_390]
MLGFMEGEVIDLLFASDALLRYGCWDRVSRSLGHHVNSTHPLAPYSHLGTAKVREPGLPPPPIFPAQHERVRPLPAPVQQLEVNVATRFHGRAPIPVAIIPHLVPPLSATSLGAGCWNFVAEGAHGGFEDVY